MDILREMIVNELTSKEGIFPWIEGSFKSHWKNSIGAEKLRIKGNSVFAQMSEDALQMEEIYKLYSRSIAFAECDSEELAFGYGNRSAILFRMKKYKECIADIDSALKINNSEKFSVKLLCRKVKCVKNLTELNTESERLFTEIDCMLSTIKEECTNKKILIETVKEKVKNICVTDEVRSQEMPNDIKDLLYKKENENPFDSVSIRWDKKYGRYLAVNRDFKPGEIIFVEKPYVSALNTNSSHNVCGHCLVVSWATIPCNYCNWCMFCSEDCKKLAWESYHNIECGIVAQLIYMDIENIIKPTQLTIRSLLLGIREARGVQSLKEEIEKINQLYADKRIQNFEKNHLFKSLGFKALYLLHDEIDAHNLSAYVRATVMCLMYLMKHNLLFDENIKCNLENILLNDDLLFIGSLILKLYKISDMNAYQISEIQFTGCKYSKDFSRCKSAGCCERGSGIMIIGSLINSSCNPQTGVIISNKSKKSIICSLRPIKKDSQIFLPYFTNYLMAPKIQRKQIMKSGFNFTCTCEACEENWPTMENLFHSVQNHYRKSTFCKEIMHGFILQDIVLKLKSAEVTLNSMEMLSKAICKANEDLKHPSRMLGEYETTVLHVLRKLYDNC